MSGDVINLRRVRKAKRRVDDAAVAAVQRVRYGRTSSERAAEAIEAERARRLLDGAYLDSPPDPDDGR